MKPGGVGENRGPRLELVEVGFNASRGTFGSPEVNGMVLGLLKSAFV